MVLRSSIGSLEVRARSASAAWAGSGSAASFCSSGFSSAGVVDFSAIAFRRFVIVSAMSRRRSGR